jgi:hypothetical protein
MMGRHFLSEILAFKLKMQSISSMKREEEEENKTKDKEAGVSWPISCRYLMQQVDNTQG